MKTDTIRTTEGIAQTVTYKRPMHAARTSPVVCEVRLEATGEVVAYKVQESADDFHWTTVDAQYVSEVEA